MWVNGGGKGSFPEPLQDLIFTNMGTFSVEREGILNPLKCCNIVLIGVKVELVNPSLLNLVPGPSHSRPSVSSPHDNPLFVIGGARERPTEEEEDCKPIKATPGQKKKKRRRALEKEKRDLFSSHFMSSPPLSLSRISGRIKGKPRKGHFLFASPFFSGLFLCLYFGR